MDSPKNTYSRLLKQFLRDEITGQELSDRFMHRYLSESRPMSAEMFNVLETIFSSIEGFVPDGELLAELRKEEPRQGWYFDEQELRERLQQLFKRLNKVKR